MKKILALSFILSIQSHAAITSDFSCSTNEGVNVYFEVTPENNLYFGHIRLNDTKTFEPSDYTLSFELPEMNARDGKNYVQIKETVLVEDLGDLSIYSGKMDLHVDEIQLENVDVKCTKTGEA